MRFEGVSKTFPDGAQAVTDLHLAVDDGEFLILVGPSGCGKTTALRMMAGLEEATSGELYIDDRPVTNLEPRERGIAMVFQSFALYPHMTVERNIGFPLKRVKEMSKPAREERVVETARLLGLEGLLRRKPHQLSGGQRQRVAIGRALVREPVAFLMDEPLSNLDASLRVQMRTELQALHRRLGITTLYVTHDQVEAMTLGTRVAVLKDGVLQQVDHPKTLYDAPANTFVAKFTGTPQMNLFSGTVTADDVRIAGCRVAERSPALRDEEVLVGIRPEDLFLEADDMQRGLAVTVELAEVLGPEVYLHFRLVDSDVGSGKRLLGDERPCIARLGARDLVALPEPGERLWLAPDSERVHLFDKRTERAIPRASRLTL